MLKYSYYLILLHIILVGCGDKTGQYKAESSSTADQFIINQYEIVNRIKHNPDAFTQGLFLSENRLIESTGGYGTSWISIYDLSSQSDSIIIYLDDEFFGEGIAHHDNNIYLLTWKNNTGFVFDDSTFRQINTFDYFHEGWGITSDGENLIISDGTNILHYFDPNTLKETSRKEVRDYRGFPLKNINELEYFKGYLLANIWQEEYISVIDLDKAQEVRRIDLSSISRQEGAGEDDVLNGIAYDEKTDTIYITGKNWKNIYALKIPMLNLP